MRFLIILLITLAPLCAQTKLLRFPDIHGDQVVFTYAGDLWKVSANGGTATRLTAHPGLELFARFSPDGSQIAFTGQYDGDEQVYVIPATGGEPRQLTWYPSNGPLPDRWGFDHIVYGWDAGGKRVLFRSVREYWGSGSNARLYTVSTEGGLPKPLPMPISGAGDLASDGRRVAYSPLFRDFRTWKRYQGGWAQDLYIYFLDTGETQRVTDHIRTDRDPMWVGDTLYFASDRSGTLNLYRFESDTNRARQITRSDRWDIRWPSSDGVSRIVYEQNGELHILAAKNGKSRKLDILVPDDGLHARPKRVSAARNIEDFELSPDGKRALFIARGDVFTAPIEKGPTRNLTRTPDAHERSSRWSPDGRWIAYVSDKTGEDQMWRIAQDGSGEPEQLTKDRAGMIFHPEWSPDSKHIAFSDKEGRLFVLEVATKQLTEVANEERGQVRHYVWSPRSGHLAFALTAGERTRALHIWSAAAGQTRRITGEMFDEWSPAWDPEGNYLYYLSDRTFAPQISTVEWNFAGDRQTGIFAMALRKDTPHPFPPESDEAKVETGEEEDDETEEKDEKDKDKEKDKEPIQIDFDGLSERVSRVPVDADNYLGLSAKKGHLLYVKRPPFYYGRQAGAKASLQIFTIKDRKAETLVSDVSGYALSANGEKVLIRQGSKHQLYDAKPKAKDPKTVSTAGLKVDSVPRTEWRLVFDEVWRRYRDFFYVENMHGYDWPALRKQYEPWLDHVGHRYDLNYVMGEMASELTVGHAYISGGDFQKPGRPQVALLGCELEADDGAGRYRIAKILRGQNEEERYRSPLREIGVDVSEGDYLLAIDGEELTTRDNPYRLLRHKADRPAELTVNSQPSSDGA
ncbi:MAG: peptidase S41, partial [bacterium]|nr:peptidase S41 [bacterium]